MTGLFKLAKRFPQPVHRLKDGVARRKRQLAWLAVAVVSVGAVLLYRQYTHDMTAHYGWHSVSRAVVIYMEKNDSRWPRSWDDLAPHLNDSFDHELLKRYWGVAWDIDPVKLYREEPCRGGDNRWPIYSRRTHPDGRGPFCFPRGGNEGTVRGVEQHLLRQKLIEPAPGG